MRYPLEPRRRYIFRRALFTETIELLSFAEQPLHRLPAAIAEARVREYYRYRLGGAIARLVDDSEPLAAVLEEIASPLSGIDWLDRWSPPPLRSGPELRLPLPHPLRGQWACCITLRTKTP
jgi:hypothetical protein